MWKLKKKSWHPILKIYLKILVWNLGNAEIPILQLLPFFFLFTSKRVLRTCFLSEDIVIPPVPAFEEWKHLLTQLFNSAGTSPSKSRHIILILFFCLPICSLHWNAWVKGGGTGTKGELSLWKKKSLLIIF